MTSIHSSSRHSPFHPTPPPPAMVPRRRNQKQLRGPRRNAHESLGMKLMLFRIGWPLTIAHHQEKKTRRRLDHGKGSAQRHYQSMLRFTLCQAIKVCILHYGRWSLEVYVWTMRKRGGPWSRYTVKEGYWGICDRIEGFESQIGWEVWSIEAVPKPCWR